MLTEADSLFILTDLIALRTVYFLGGAFCGFIFISV